MSTTRANDTISVVIFDDKREQAGLTKREYFAALAMSGFLGSDYCEQSAKKVAEWSVDQADALIDALNGVTEGDK